MHFVGLLWPLLTSRSAGRPNSAMPASPFQASGETSPGKNDDLPRTIAGSTPLPLGRRSFAVSGPLAPVRSASYPVPVRRLTGSFHASFSVRLTTNALRFPSVPATRFREDFHLQVIAHAGPTTTQTGEPISGLSRFCKSLTPNHFSNRDGRIELRAPSAPSARLAENIWIYRELCRRSARTYGSVGRLRRPTRPRLRRARRIRPPLLPAPHKQRGPQQTCCGASSRDGRIRTGDPLNPITHSLYAISREIPVFLAGFGENFLELELPNPGIQGGYVLEKVLKCGSSGTQST